MLSSNLRAAIHSAQRHVLARPSNGDTGAQTTTLRLPGNMAVLLSLNK